MDVCWEAVENFPDNEDLCFAYFHNVERKFFKIISNGWKKNQTYTNFFEHLISKEPK